MKEPFFHSFTNEKMYRVQITLSNDSQISENITKSEYKVCRICMQHYVSSICDFDDETSLNALRFERKTFRRSF